MHTFRSEVVLDRPVEEVFAWHERQGALRRLLPPWEPVTVVQEAPDLTEGSEAVLRLSGPGAVAPRWVARHTGLRAPYEFTDVQVSGPFAAWRHHHVFEPAGDGGCRLVDEVTYELPLGPAGDRAKPMVEARLRRMFAYRHRQLADDLAAHAAAGVPPMTVAVTGASGFVGTALTAFLTSGGHRVVRLVRRAPRVPDESAWDPERGLVDAEVLRTVDAVVHLAGTPIAGRFNHRHKESVRRSRVAGTRLLARTIARLRAEGDGPRVFVTASAIGYYGADRGGEVLDEESGPGRDFLAEVCREWEAATCPAREAGARVAYVRTGLVQSPLGGTLRIQLPQFWAGLGGRLGTGEQWQSWISLDDIVGVYHHVLTRDGISGPVNGVAPEPVTNAAFTATLGRVLHRPTLVPTPSFGPRLLLGDEGADLTAFASQNVHSGVLAGAGYRFRQPDLESCLRHVLGR
ncbi:TIGR01777 family oxidoreductase [Actinocatenispora rupis]|uniref:Nucleoside-diphosphate sugar epimerase n=1 Tax=Actinocatenispora rupis TaxID=519421 RepID=A0A8J3J567_9ACTN|nr:TIGR01777 family oxidoreductase [Actinocatenispora rupis]GID14333.1 nucleoside-diphosphate sugar epimerase [Actinocatenispora rupis]